MLKVAAVLEESIVDGPGIRSVVFFQGCPRHCEGCHNPDLLPFEGGTKYTPRQLADEVFARLTPLHRGITLSGGDPLAQAEELVDFLEIVRRERPQLTVWCYTGYLYDEVKEQPVLQLIDVLVDGPFILAQRNLDLPFRGSDNQRLIDLPAARMSGSVVEVNL
ncbi:anaerobic ribonucleoside-triphosphate reductase activating protein [Phascolarctobacterium sp.]